MAMQPLEGETTGQDPRECTKASLKTVEIRLGFSDANIHDMDISYTLIYIFTAPLYM